MTKAERSKPDLLAKSASRRRRVARGSGRSEAQVSELLSTFMQMRVQMKSMSKMMAQAGGMGTMPPHESSKKFGISFD
jgi:signal recognition particle subunit SRP54